MFRVICLPRPPDPRKVKGTRVKGTKVKGTGVEIPKSRHDLGVRHAASRCKLSRCKPVKFSPAAHFQNDFKKPSLDLEPPQARNFSAPGGGESNGPRVKGSIRS